MAERRRSVWRIASAVALFAAGCSVFDQGPEPPPVPAGVTTGGVLRVGITRPVSIEPSLAYEPMSQMVTKLVCEPLVSATSTTGRYTRGIARNLTVAGGGTLVSVQLRKDVRFNDGRELRAADVSYSLSRAAREDFASPLAELLSPVVGYERLHRTPGAPGPTGTADQPEVDPTAPERTTLAGIVQISSGALSIALSQADGEYMHVLTHPVAAPYSRSAAEKDPEGFARKPVCVGPYELETPYNDGDAQINLRRAPRYYGQNTAYPGGGRGFPDRIELRIYSDLRAAYAGYVAGDVDVVPVPPEDLPAARGFGGDLLLAPALSVEYVGVPTTRPPFDDPRVRRALSLALDRERIVTEVFEGGRLPAERFYPPTFAGLPPNEPCAASLPARGDVTRARDLLREAGQDLSGSVLPLYFNDEFRNGQLMRSVAQQWEEAFGLRVELRGTDFQQFQQRARAPGGYDGPFRFSWAPEYPSLDRFVAPLFHSDSIGRDNLSLFRNVTFDRRLERTAQAEDDGNARMFAYLELEALLCSQMPMIPLTFGQNEFLVRQSHVGSAGVPVDTSYGELDLRRLYVK